MRKKALVSVLVGLMILLLVGCAVVADKEGFKVGDPEALARATHIAEMSQRAADATETAVALETTRTVENINAQATAAAIYADKQRAEAGQLQAKATIASARARTAEQVQPSEAAGKSAAYLLGYAGLGVGVLVLCIGMAFALSAWMHKRATVVYPDKHGLFPLVPERGPGWAIYHDPNRALGPGTVITRPGISEWLVQSANHLLGRAEARKPGADYPQTASEGAMLQIGTGAQLVQNKVAEQSGRPKLLVGISPQGEQPVTPKGSKKRLPPITVINDPEQIEALEHNLLESGDEDED